MADAPHVVGANPPGRYRQTAALGAVLHHTDTVNRDLGQVGVVDPAVEVAEAKKVVALVRRIHLTKFSDIGYNFIVTRGGVVCEGRRGSFAAAKEGRVVQGAHAGSTGAHNRTHYGVALEGHYHEGEAIPKRQREALVELLVWLAATASFDADAILEHRRVRAKPTLCPGWDEETTRGIRGAVTVGLLSDAVTTVPPWRLGASASSEQVKVGANAHGVAELEVRPSPDKAWLPMAAVELDDGHLRAPLLGDELLFVDIWRTPAGTSGAAAASEWTVAPGGALGAFPWPDAGSADDDEMVVELPAETRTLPLAQGIAELEVGQALKLRFNRRKRTVSLETMTEGRVTLRFDIALRVGQSHLDVETAPESSLHQWSELLELERDDAAGGHAFQVAVDVPAGTPLLSVTWPDVVDWGSKPYSDLRLDDWRLEGGTWGPVARLSEGLRAALSVEAAQKVKLPRLRVPSMQGGQQPPLWLEVKSVAFERSTLVLRGIRLFSEADSDWAFTADELDLDDDFHLRGQGGRFELSLNGPAKGIVLEPGSSGLPTLVVHGGVPFVLSFAADEIALRAEGSAGPIATVVMPALGEADGKELAADPQWAGPALDKRFVLTVEPHDAESGFRLSSASGLRLQARALPHRVELGEEASLDDVTTVGGHLTLDGSQWIMSIAAEASLPWIRGARGRLTVTAGSAVTDGLAIDASFQSPLGAKWTDPSGVLTFHEPVAHVSVGWAGGWKVDGALSGSLEIDAAAISAGAAELASDVLDNLRLDFEGLSLVQLTGLGKGNGEGRAVTLRFLEPYRGTLWDDVFGFELDAFRLLPGERVAFGGKVGFDFGPVAFSGRVPDIVLSFGGSRRVDLAPGFVFDVAGSLTVPSGIRASMQLSRTSEGGLDAIDGRGRLDLPGLGDFDVVCSLGRWTLEESDEALPSLLVHAELDYVQPLYPGVVLRRVGLGLGLHRGLRGSDVLVGMSTDQKLAWLRSESTPSPRHLSSWVPTTVPLSFVMSGMFSATTGPASEADVYVADLTACLDPALRLALHLDGWALTSLDDARTSHLKHPYVKGVATIDPGRPSISAAMTTLQGAKHSLGPGLTGKLVSTMLDTAQMEAALEARPDRFHWRLGPRSVDLSLGPVRARGSQTMVLGATRRGAWVAGQLQVGVHVEKSVSVNVSPASFRITASAGLEGALTYYGGVHGGALQLLGTGRVRAYFTLSVSVRIELRIRFRVRFGPFKVKVKIRVRVRTSQVSKGVDADVALAVLLGTHAGAAIEATACLRARIVGFPVSATFDYQHDPGGHLAKAKGAHRAALTARGNG